MCGAKLEADFNNSSLSAVVDVWAPGVSILSAYIGSTTATARLSGTSMATPYVAGILAYVLSEYGQVTPVCYVPHTLLKKGPISSN
jgi:subtilisin family serine protease